MDIASPVVALSLPRAAKTLFDPPVGLKCLKTILREHGVVTHALGGRAYVLRSDIEAVVRSLQPRAKKGKSDVNFDALERDALKAGVRNFRPVLEDAVDAVGRQFEQLEDGSIVHKPTGKSAAEWYADRKIDKPHWFQLIGGDGLDPSTVAAALDGGNITAFAKIAKALGTKEAFAAWCTENNVDQNNFGAGSSVKREDRAGAKKIDARKNPAADDPINVTGGKYNAAALGRMSELTRLNPSLAASQAKACGSFIGASRPGGRRLAPV